MSELWERKLRTYFNHLDVKGNGFILMKDMVDMVERYCDAVKATDAQREETIYNFADMFRRWKKASGTDDNGVLTPSILIESVKQQRNDPDFKAAYMRMHRQFFQILDHNGDGYLQEEDYVRAAVGLGWKDSSFVHGAFECMDVNEDGKVSLEEYCIAIFEYVTSEDENNRYNMIFGPLV